jgi:hypothetical protein
MNEHYRWLVHLYYYFIRGKLSIFVNYSRLVIIIGELVKLDCKSVKLLRREVNLIMNLGKLILLKVLKIKNRRGGRLKRFHFHVKLNPNCNCFIIRNKFFFFEEKTDLTDSAFSRVRTVDDIVAYLNSIVSAD